VKVITIVVALLPSFALALGPGSRPAASTPEVRIRAKPGRDWELAYRLREPTQKLAFAWTEGPNRSATWITDPDFQIVSTGDGEIIRRRDGGTFATVHVAIPPAYGSGDYGHFMPFGDVAIIFYTAGLLACEDACPEDARWS